MKDFQNILVVGTGFVSKNIFGNQNQYDSKNTNVISLSRAKYFPFSDRHITADFTDQALVSKTLKEERITQIFLFLGPSFPSISNEYIISDVNTYLVSFLNLIENSLKHNVKEIVMLSSAGTVYGSTYTSSYQEDILPFQENSYGILLKTMENYLLLASKTNGINYKILRLSNVFGLYHESNLNGFINIAIRNTLKNLPVKVFSNNAYKNYIFSKDLAKIFWEVNNKVNTNCILNIASDSSFSLFDLCSKIKDQLPNLITIKNLQNISYDTIPPVVNNVKLKTLIDFKFTPIQVAIKETLEWEKSILK
jgi:UDP-glucose 4-epimerase